MKLTHLSHQLFIIMRKNIKNLASMRALSSMAMLFMLLAAALTSCTNETPAPYCNEFKLRLNFETGMDTLDYEYTRSQGLDGVMTYTVRVFDVKNGLVQRDSYHTYTFTRNVSGDYNFETSIDLAPGNYHVMVWAQFRVDGRYYYDADNFNSISVTDPYEGNTDYRQAFAGTADLLDINFFGSAQPPVAEVTMERPLAKYTFVATDLKQFLKEESEENGRQMNLDDYYVVVRYPQFMPSAYNMWTGRPSDSLTGIKYTADITEYGDGEACLGFDYVFVNHNESSVTVQLFVYAKSDNHLVASSKQIRVPLKRNFNTIVRGGFLMALDSGGVGIDPGYDGDFTIFAPFD